MDNHGVSSRGTLKYLGLLRNGLVTTRGMNPSTVTSHLEKFVMLTIMALSVRASEHLAAEIRLGKV
jgi:hypothetical protein